MGNSCYSNRIAVGSSYRENEKQIAKFQIEDLPALSTYTVEIVYAHQSQRLFKDESAFRLYGGYVCKLEQDGKQFTDPKLRLPQDQSTRISRLYNRSKSPKMFASTGSQVLQQGNNEYTYLSAVFCYIANNPDLLKRLILTQPNEQAFYVTRYFPNGDNLMVAVDDIVPSNKGSLLYSKSAEFELWMYILEKAWVKLVGGYEFACGLSPEDAFEEILGAPAYSYLIQERDPRALEQLERLIRIKKQQNNCIILTSRKNEYNSGKLLSRQVFYVQKFDSCGGIDFVKLRCPFSDFRYKGQLQQRSTRIPELNKLLNQVQANPNTLYLTPAQIFNTFEFCTIGCIRPNYETKSYAFTSDFNQSVYFQIIVSKKEPVSMRVIQYYQGYVRNNVNYQYSAVYIQLFEMSTRKLKAEGCRRAIYGYKTANVFEELFEEMDVGKYFLRIDIEWKFPQKMRQARLVSYCSANSIQISRTHKSDGDRILSQLIGNIIQQQPSQSIDDLKYGARWLNNSVYLFYKNIAAKQLQIIINLKSSMNLIPTTGNFTGKIIEITLEPHQSKVIEMRKANVKQEGSLGEYMIEIK